jgi:hypothetical protein
VKRFAIAAALLLAVGGETSCRARRPRARPAQRGIDQPEAPLPLPDATLMPGVLAPRLLPAAANASVRQQAVESIGTYEWQDFTAPGSRLVNTNGDYWTHLADLAWRRDIEIHLDGVPLDLDQDGRVDTRVTRHLSLRAESSATPTSSAWRLIPTILRASWATPRPVPAFPVCATPSISKPANPRATSA